MRKFILITALALGTTAARAENGFWYVGAGIVSNSTTGMTLEGLGSLPDITGPSWKAYAGVRPLKWLAGELDYIDLGSGQSSIETSGFVYANSDGKAVAAYAVGFLPIPLPVLDVFGKMGVARSQLNGSTIIGFHGPTWGSSSINSTEFAWGIGVQGHINLFGARLEYEQFKIPNSSGAKVASLSVFLNF